MLYVACSVFKKLLSDCSSCPIKMKCEECNIYIPCCFVYFEVAMKMALPSFFLLPDCDLLYFRH